jgi:tetratricopeptide (TPR) repeat protein
MGKLEGKGGLARFNNLNVRVLAAIILCGLALYSLPLQNAHFYFDDHDSIENNAVIRQMDVPKIFSTFNTRFLVGLSFALNYRLCRLHPAGYRIVNLLIHCLNAFLVYLLVKATLYLYQARKPVFFCRLEWPAFFASMLFLCHPLQTEPVNFITQRFVLLGSFFYLLTLFLYIRYRCLRLKRYLAAAMTCAIAAMFCKEFTVTLPVMIGLYELYFLGFNEGIWQRCRHVIPFFVIALIVPVLLLRTPAQAVGVANIADSSSIQEGQQGTLEHIDITRARNSMGRKPYFFTELNVLCTYVRLLFLPVHQNLDYDYPVSRQMDGKTFMSALFLLFLLALAAGTYTSCRIMSFGILWFFVALSVESSLIPIGNVINEYRVYLACAGFVFVVMTWIYMRRVEVKKLNMLAAVILAGLSIMTYQRNKVWKDELSLWSDTVHKSPRNARAYNGRAIAYIARGDYKEAILDFNKAVELAPGYALAYNNQGGAYFKMGNYAQAVSDFNKAIELNPRLAEAYNGRAIAYNAEGHYSQAISDLNKAIELNPNYVEAYSNRWLAYGVKGNYKEAVSDYNKAIDINPNDAEAYNNRGSLYYRQGRLVLAMSDFDKAIETNPHYAQAYYNRGLVFDHQGRMTQAESDYKKALALDPRLTEAYNNLGGACYGQSDFEQAIVYYTKAIEINPANPLAYANRAMAYYQLKDYNKAWADVRHAEKQGASINPLFLNALKAARK